MTERTLFLEALEIFDPQERHAFLRKACAGNLELRSQVEELIKAHEAGGDFMADPAPEITARSISEGPGTTIGPYKLLEQIGEGGFGVVFMAEQQRPVRRKVALKVIKVGMDTRQVVARFEAERQALALMDHPNIAKVFDAGATDAGRPFFVMELIRGLPITEYCDQNQLTPRDRLELFIPVCLAVQHAHQKGIIHRDIKPTNVLVTLHDGVPVVKVIDFGIAKATGEQLTEKTLFTNFAQMIGTPLYMSPEQAALSSLDVDTRSDIYSLGVLLYELLTGTTPFEKERFHDSNCDEVRRMIREVEPPRPSTRVTTLGDKSATIVARRRTDVKALGRLYRGDLDWIVMKALTKDRTGRYATALDLALDVERYTNDEQVEARPPTLRYRLQKFAHKNRVFIDVFATVVAVLLIGIATTSWQAIRALTAERNAIIQRDLANDRERDLWRQAYPANILASHRASHGGNLNQARELLARYEPQDGREELRGFEWYFLRNLCGTASVDRIAFRAHDTHVFNLAFSPDGRLLVTCSADKTARLWDLSKKKLIQTFEGHGSDVNCALFARAGRDLITASDDGTIRTWDIATGKQLAILVTVSGLGGTTSAPVEIADVALSRDEKTLAAACWDGTVRLYDFPSGTLMRVLTAHLTKAETLAFAADSKTLITGGRDGFIKTWDYHSGQLGSTYKSDGECKSIAAAHSLPFIAIAGYDGKVSARNLTTDTPLLTFTDQPMQRVAFSPDDKTLAACDFFGGIWQIDIATEKLVYRTIGMVRPWAVAYSPDGNILAAGSGDGMVTLFPNKKLHPWIAQASAAAISPDGGTIVTVLEDCVRSWDSRIRGLQKDAFCLPDRRSRKLLSPDGRTLFALMDDGALQIWDLALRQVRAKVHLNCTVDDGIHLETGGAIVCTAAHNKESTIRVWDSMTGTQLFSFSDPDLKNAYFWLSTDGSLLGTIHGATICLAGSQPRFVFGKGDIHIHEPKSGRLIAKLPLPESGADCFAFCRRGKKHAIGCADLSIRVDDLETGQRNASLHGHKARISCIAFAPDGKTLASSSWDGTVKLWHLATGKELLTLEGHRGRVQGIAFSQDGRVLISWGDNGGQVFMWDARDG